jgi:type IV pilus assembly protein PilQ
MKRRLNLRSEILPIVICLSLLIVISACSSNSGAVKKNPFFDKWVAKAGESLGNSPEPVNRQIDIPEAVKEGYSLESGSPFPSKPLPRQPVTIRILKSDIKTILRALARAANQNILIKEEIKGEVNLDVKNVPWDQVFRSVMRSQGLSYEWDGNIIRVLSPQDKKAEPLITTVININYADVKQVRDNIQEFLSKDDKGTVQGSVKIDEHSSALIVRASRDDIARMIPVIEKIDKPKHQIMIKANIVEASKSAARNLGVQWGGVYSNKWGSQNYYITPGGSQGGGTSTSPTTPVNPNSYLPSTGSTGISGQGFATNFPIGQAAINAAGGLGSLGLIFGTIGGNLLEVQLQALENDGSINILSSPSITCLDNQMAYTENGTRVPYVTLSTAGGVASQEVKFEDVVLRLEITPHVIDDNNLRLKIKVKKDEVDPLRNVLGNPYIEKKQTETLLFSQDGETIVISGLSKQSTTKTNSGLPWLGDIPVLGYLFKADSKSEEKQEVLIFITPHILKTKAVAQANIKDEKETVKLKTGQ